MTKLVNIWFYTGFFRIFVVESEGFQEMKFDFARLPFIPAFLALLLLTLLWASTCIMPDAVPADQLVAATQETAPTEEQSREHTLTATPQQDPIPQSTPAAQDPAPQDALQSTPNPLPTDSLTGITASDSTLSSTPDTLAQDLPEPAPARIEKPRTPPRMAFEMPATLIRNFAARHPFRGKTLSVLVILFLGVTIGRVALRHNLYTVNSALPVPLSFMLILLVGIRGLTPPALVGMLFFALAIKNFARCFRSGYTFDANFRAGLYSGLMLLVHPASMPLLVLFPVALFVFNRTLREAVAASAGLLFPIAFCSYLNWGMRGDFTAPLWQIWQQFATGTIGGFLTRFILPDTPVQIVLALLTLLSIALVVNLLYSVGTKPRYILLYAICATIVGMMLCLSPSADAPTVAFVAIPASLIITGFLVRTPRMNSAIIVVVLFAATVVRIFLQ